MVMEKVKYYLCKKCGNLVRVINQGGGTLTCCNESMQELKPNTVDASQEKHIPVAIFEEGILNIKIGSIMHPMIDEHYIMWIHVITQDGTIYSKSFEPGDIPEVTFKIADLKKATIYAYCNIHGLWKSEI
jgi:superoxide reductase